MTASSRGRIVASALLLPIALGLAACGGSSEKDKGAATAKCPANLNATATTPLPSDVPAPAGASTPYDSFAQGATNVWYFAIDGKPADLPSLRDGYDSTLESKGYTIEGTDQEANAEAESDFSGPHDGTSNFRPLCDGKVVLRLKLTS